MRKSITKIICSAVAVISASAMAFAPACSVKWNGVAEKDNSAVVAGANGGFVTETADYVYFINGVTPNTAVNKFGTVLKGSVQRIKRSDLDACNYAKTETVVPSVIYSGNYNAGLYIYDGYVYYTSPATEKNTDGEVLNENLDFKRTKLDGTGTETIWQSADNAVDYRYVKAGETVYILYALSENLYGTSATNVHSVNCTTKENTLLAYKVSDYAFDTVNVENASVYYTMDVPQFLGESSTYSYNQLFKVRADATTPREIDFSAVENYDKEKNPVYVNCGQFVFDGIGKLNYSDRLSQLNFTQDKDKYKDVLVNDDYTYDIQSYKNGKLYYTRRSNGSNLTNLYVLNDDAVGADGKVSEGWDAITKNGEQTAFILGSDTTNYEYYEKGGVTYALNATADGIFRYEVADKKYDNEVKICSDASATLLTVREEHENVNVYYSVTGGNGYTFNRIAVDGSDSDYRKLPVDVEPNATYRSVRILDLDANSSWYKPEFVGSKLLYASAGAGQTDRNYICVCDLTGADGIMTNNEVKKLNEKYEEVAKEFDKYTEDGDEVLAKALKYVFNTGDADYVDELVKAYVDVMNVNEEHVYGKDDVKVIKSFAVAEGDYAKYRGEGYTKTVNGETVYATDKDFFYSVLGRMTEADETGVKDYFKNEYMEKYPEDTRTWWQKLSTGAKAGFIIGVCAGGLLVIGGVALLIVYLVRRRRKDGGEVNERAVKVDITDDRSVNVYGDGDGENSVENTQE